MSMPQDPDHEPDPWPPCICRHSFDAHVSVLLYCTDCGCSEYESEECTCGGVEKHLACDLHRDEVR